MQTILGIICLLIGILIFIVAGLSFATEEKRGKGSLVKVSDNAGDLIE